MLNPFFKNKSINQVNKIILVVILFITIFSTLFLFLSTYHEHQSELQKIEQDYINSQKESIKNETLRAIKYITYKYNKSNKQHTNIKDLKDEIVDAIENMRNVRNGSGYIFIYTFDGINIADPILKQNANKNLIDFKDPNGKLVIKELIDISKQPNGGYVRYVWNKPTTNQLTDKISYAIAFKPLHWMIGSGVYLDDVQKVLKQKKDEYKRKIFNYILQISILAFVLFLSGIIISRYFTSLISDNINKIEDVLINVSTSYEKIDTQQLDFKEFKKISESINIMIDELKDLNQNLEKKVITRTQKLQESEQYAKKLLESQDKFLKNAVHEINTPLSIIITNIDLYNLKFDKNRYISKIEAGSKIIHNIYNDLSYLIKKDRIEYPKRSIDFSNFLLQRIDFFNEVAIGNNLNIKSLIEDEIIINFNETQLQRLIDNTISNAIKYSYENNDIDILLKLTKDNVSFSITNIGDTILEPDKLFERFYRENESRGGFGIGLNIIKEICDNNNVIIELVSEKNRTTFKYIFENKQRG